MSGVTGPISTLPGSRHSAPQGVTCDEHKDRPAVARIQGETDSFGSEMLDLCAECVAELAKHANEGSCGRCDWCKSDATDLRPRRDYDEGMCGPVYQVCGACVSKENKRLAEEAYEWERERGDYDADFDD